MGTFIDGGVLVAYTFGYIAGYTSVELPLVAYAVEIKLAVADYQNMWRRKVWRWRTLKRCRAAWEMLQNLSDETYDALEPMLIDEIAVLHDLYGGNDDEEPQ